MPKKKINAKEVVRDIKAGMHNNALMQKYELSPGQLKGLIKKLEDAGLIKPPEPEELAPDAHDTFDEPYMTCPACGYGQNGEFDDCPRCGVVVSKYEPPKPPPGTEQSPDGSPKKPAIEVWPEQTKPNLRGIKIIVVLALILVAFIALVLYDKHRKAQQAMQPQPKQEEMSREPTEEEHLDGLTKKQPKDFKDFINKRLPKVKPINPALDRHMRKSFGEVGDSLNERSRARDDLTNQP